MKDFLIRLMLAGGAMAIIDAFWLSVVANKFYKSQIDSLPIIKPSMPAAVAFISSTSSASSCSPCQQLSKK